MWVSKPELESIIGADMAKVLMVHLGGVPVYIPAQPRHGHKLIKLIGERAALALCRSFPKEYITVPNGRTEPQKDKILAMLAQGGKTQREIAMDCGVTERYVSLLSRLERPMQQLTLF